MSTDRDDADPRAECAALIAESGVLAARHEGTLFTRPAAAVAAALDEIADLRAAALFRDGHQAVALAGDQNSAELRDLRLLAATAVEAMDEVLQVVEGDWLALPDDTAAVLLDAPELAPYRHYLTSVRSLAPYTLGAEAETALAAREATAGSAWVELYYRVMGGLRPVVDGGAISMEEARSELEVGAPARREACLEAIYAALEPMAPVLSQCLDSLVADRLAIDEVRGLPHPRAERDLTNELPSTAVDAMLAAVEENYALPQRWFAHKARLLGLDRLGYAHMRAPIGRGPHLPFPVAVRAVTEAFEGVSPEAGRMVRDLVDGGHVDAEPREGKQPGASCRSLGPGRPPRIVLSYFGTVEDVVSLAHEMGHALQFTLAGRGRNGLTFDAPLALNEIAPAFTELLVQDWLIEHEPDRDTRELLAAKRVDNAIDAIFMSAFLTRFETRAHRARAEGGALTDPRIRALWTECGREFYGPDVAMSTRWGLHWALVPHVTHERFYSYTYTFARLLGLDFHARYRRDPDGFRGPFLDLLARGGTAGPTEQLAALGVDLEDRETWRGGLAHFAELLDPLLAERAPTR
ncbi:M3 family metallopeptidase [Actinosynnema sp. NPDC020468]|uniref:M3 family metallopeptidase n=1 Tax=Actinosynnema sp. NPDC020468 TaxID=3154488 RepID=UPI0033C6A853